MKPVLTTVSALLAGLSLAAAATTQTAPAPDKTRPAAADNASKDAPNKSQTTTPGAKEASVVRADRDFLEKAAHAGHAEVEASKLAQAKASNADVKSFAGKMVDDHAKAADELKQLASSKGVKLPDGPTVADRAKLKMLATAEGERFDKRYAETFGVKAHEDTVKLFQNAAGKAQDSDIKAFAEKTLPKLQEHLTMAKSMHAAVDPPAAGKSAVDKTAAQAEKADKAARKQTEKTY